MIVSKLLLHHVPENSEESAEAEAKNNHPNLVKNTLLQSDSPSEAIEKSEAVHEALEDCEAEAAALITDVTKDLREVSETLKPFVQDIDAKNETLEPETDEKEDDISLLDDAEVIDQVNDQSA